MYVGIFDMKERLEKTRKVLKEKEHLKQLIEDDIRQLQDDVQSLEKMVDEYAVKVLR